MVAEQVVDDVMGTALVTIGAHRTLRGAAELLLREEVGVAVVESHTGPFGIISERDIVRAIAEGEDPDDARVADYMSYEVCAIDAGATLHQAAQAMEHGNIRHLVVRRDERVVGVVSARDLVFAGATR